MFMVSEIHRLYFVLLITKKLFVKIPKIYPKSQIIHKKKCPKYLFKNCWFPIDIPKSLLILHSEVPDGVVNVDHQSKAALEEILELVGWKLHSAATFTYWRRLKNSMNICLQDNLIIWSQLVSFSNYPSSKPFD